MGELGKGEFGVVLKAEARGLPGMTGDVCFVAVKTLKDGASENDRKDYLSEADLLNQFEHENVLGLLGVCLKEEPWLIVIEVCDGERRRRRREGGVVKERVRESVVSVCVRF